MYRLDDYEPIVGKDLIAFTRQLSKYLKGRRIIHLNSTYHGGGVAEILNSLVFLMNDIGIETDWRIINGTRDFFTVTKEFHNALQGGDIKLTANKKHLYEETLEKYSRYCRLDADCVIVHDPQPLMLIDYYPKKQPWIWLCHIDLTKPNLALWNYLVPSISRYDRVLISSDRYRQPDLTVEQTVVYPAIDPLTDKNKPLGQEESNQQLRVAGIPTDKPFITQVSRMDPWKDPEGVLEVFRLVREEVDCRLVFCYNSASDDPEGDRILKKVRRKANNSVDTGDIIFVVGDDEILVNAIQRAAHVVLQKSTREGFSLTVTEAMWKGKPVVGGNVGGIPVQITDGKNGFLVDPIDYVTCAKHVIDLLKNPDLNCKIGKEAHKSSSHTFLITRLLRDYLIIINQLFE